jgi:hypothetical protein
MQRIIGLFLLPIALFLSLAAMGCDNASSEDIATSLEDRLTDALDFDGGENADGVPDPGDGSGEAPQIEEWQVPGTLRLGQPFVVTIATNFDSNSEALTTAIYVKGAKNHLHVRRDLGILPDGRKRMSLYGVLAVDEQLRGKTFELELSLKTEDGVMGLPVPWPLKIEDEDPVALEGEPIDMLTMIGEDWIASGRPEGDPSGDAPQILRIDGPYEFPISVATMAGPVSDNVSDFNRIAAVLLSTPGNPGYKRSTVIQPENLEDGLALRVELKIKPEVPDGTPLVFVFALEDVDGRVGLFQPYSIVAFKNVDVDGDADDDVVVIDGDGVDRDTVDGDVVIDGDTIDGDMIDGDTSDTEETDGDVQCVCEAENACCDGCQPINNGGDCDPQQENAWTGYCAEGQCVPLSFQTYILKADAALTRVDLSADGSRLAAAFFSSVEIFDTETWQSLQQMPSTGETSISAVAFSPDGQQLAVAGYGQKVTLFNIEANELVNELSFDALYVNAIAYTADGSAMWVGGGASLENLAIQRIRDHARVWTSPLNHGYIYSIARIGMGERVSVNNSQMLYYANMLQRQSIAGPDDFTNSIIDQAISPSGDESAVLTCTYMNADTQICEEFGIIRFDIGDNTISDGGTFTLTSPTSLDWSPDGLNFAVGFCNRHAPGSFFCESSQVILVDAANWQLRYTLPEFTGMIQDVRFDRHNRRLLVFTQQAELFVYDLGDIGLFGPPYAWECSETDNACRNGEVCDLYTHRCRTNACADGVDNDSDGQTDEADLDCSEGGFLELDEELAR